MDNDENLFYFESDHLALRGNRDYSNVLRTIAILEAQRIRVHSQLEELTLAKKRYMENPELLLTKLKNNELIIAPNYISIEKIPEVNTYDTFPTEDIKIKDEPGTEEKPNTIRGRIIDESKPETFNQLWSCEEQRRLEELLMEYPPEEFESRRYAKIAKALGNRTPQQVCSRVQKYFQKLHDAGMPIPGRRPKNRRSGQKNWKHFYRPSTFFPAQNVSVHMPDDDFFMGELSNAQSPAPTGQTPETQSNHDASSDNTDLVGPQREEMFKRILHLLSVIREEKRNTPAGYNPDPLAAKCEMCQCAPVSQTRLRCNTCYCYVNRCSDCIVAQLLAHKFEHIMHEVVVEE